MFGLVCEFHPLCVFYVLVVDFFEDWFAYACLVDEGFFGLIFSVCVCEVSDYLCVGCLEWVLVEVAELGCVVFLFYYC